MKKSGVGRGLGIDSDVLTAVLVCQSWFLLLLDRSIPAQKRE
jgi:hypothetical protein